MHTASTSSKLETISLLLKINQLPCMKDNVMVQRLQLSYCHETKCDIHEKVGDLQKHLTNVSCQRYRNFVSKQLFTNSRIRSIDDCLFVSWDNELYN